MVTKMATQWLKSNQYIAYELQPTWSSNFHWNLCTSLQHAANKLENCGMATLPTTWHNKNIGFDTMDLAAVLSKWMAMHAETFVSMGQILKLHYVKTLWQHSAHSVINQWPFHSKLHLAYEFHQNWPSNFPWNRFTILKPVASQYFLNCHHGHKNGNTVVKI